MCILVIFLKKIQTLYCLCIAAESGELQISHDDTSVSQPAAGAVFFPTGTKVTLKCNGNVGNPAQTIQWCIKRDTDIDFGAYPNLEDITESNLTPGGDMPSCQQSHTSTLSYFISEFDVLTTFKCFVNTIEHQYTCRDDFSGPSLKVTNSGKKRACKHV